MDYLVAHSDSPVASSVISLAREEYGLGLGSLEANSIDPSPPKASGCAAFQLLYYVTQVRALH